MPLTDVDSGGQLHRTDCSSTNDAVGLVCDGGFALLAAKACDISDSSMAAHFVGSGQVTLTDTRIVRSQSTVTGTNACSNQSQVTNEGVLCSAVQAWGKELKLAMARCVVSGTYSCGLLLGDSATASLKGCKIFRSKAVWCRCRRQGH